MSSPSPSRLLVILLPLLLVAALAWWRPWAAPRVAPVTDTTVAEAPAGPPLFARWMRFEPPAVRAHAAAGDGYFDAMPRPSDLRSLPRGVPPQVGRQLMLDDDKLLLSSGRRLWTREIAFQPGLAGEICYGHSTYCLKRLVDVSFAVDGRPVVIYDNEYWVERYPSHTAIHYELPGVSLTEYKFITWDDRVAVTYTATSRDKQPHTVTIEAVANPLAIPNSRETPPAYPLLAAGNFPGHAALHLPGRAGLHASRGALTHLRRDIAVPAEGATPEISLAVRFDNAELSTPATPLPSHAAQAHEYNRWLPRTCPISMPPTPASSACGTTAGGLRGSRWSTWRPPT
jgi:hypothetical protein